MAIHLERHITRFEVLNQCILMQEDDGKTLAGKFPGEPVNVHADGKVYEAKFSDFYVKSKFIPALVFVHDAGHTSPFFFDHTVSEGKRARFGFDPADPLEDGKRKVTVEIVIVTR